MSTKVSKLQQVSVLAGVQPSTEKTALSTQHWTFSDKIRFRNGYPQKLGGWESVTYDYGVWPEGCCRTVYSAVINNNTVTMLGTNTDLYSLVGSRLTNVSPLQIDTVAAANSLSTNYTTLSNNPVTTVSGSKTLTIADTSASRFVAGDSVTLAGSSTVNGVPDTEINARHIIRSIGTNSYTIYINTAASSSGVGGGASVVRSDGLINVSSAAHGQSDGKRVKITLAGNTGGILAAEINNEFIIRNSALNSFDVMTSGIATSSVTAGGGTATVYQKQIPEGVLSESFGQGYGQGLYGMGLYGSALQSIVGKRLPRIWFMDRFADSIIMTAGNASEIYSWNGSSVAAPTILANAPTDVNYAFVSDNILVTFGSDSVDNHVFASDQNDITNWTASSTNQVFEDYIEGAGRLKSHVSVSGVNLIFTDNQTYSFTYIGLPNVWKIKLLDGAVGIISPFARCVVNGIAYWMGQKNFYMWDGSNINIVPANTQKTSTILNYVFTNLTQSQKSKIFCWYNKQFNEIWWHYPSAGSDECDRVARFNVSDGNWCPDTIERTAAEYPDNLLAYPLMIDQNGIMYNHEKGYNDDYQSMPFTLTSNLKINGKENALISGIVPDSIQSDNITVTINTVRFPQSSVKMFNSSYTVTPTTEQIPISVGGRLWDYTISGNAIDQNWVCGNWMEFVQDSSTQ